jgi:hypothetical protein
VVNFKSAAATEKQEDGSGAAKDPAREIAEEKLREAGSVGAASLARSCQPVWLLRAASTTKTKIW